MSKTAREFRQAWEFACDDEQANYPLREWLHSRHGGKLPLAEIPAIAAEIEADIARDAAAAAAPAAMAKLQAEIDELLARPKAVAAPEVLTEFHGPAEGWSDDSRGWFGDD